MLQKFATRWALFSVTSVQEMTSLLISAYSVYRSRIEMWCWSFKWLYIYSHAYLNLPNWGPKGCKKCNRNCSQTVQIRPCVCRGKRTSWWLAMGYGFIWRQVNETRVPFGDPLPPNCGLQFTVLVLPLELCIGLQCWHRQRIEFGQFNLDPQF